MAESEIVKSAPIAWELQPSGPGCQLSYDLDSFTNGSINTGTLQTGGCCYLFYKIRDNPWAAKLPVSGSTCCQCKALSGRSRRKIGILTNEVCTQVEIVHRSRVKWFFELKSPRIIELQTRFANHWWPCFGRASFLSCIVAVYHQT